MLPTNLLTFNSLVSTAPAPVTATAFESIATVEVGSGGASSVEFTSIPSDYKHLQIRGVAQDNGASTDARALVLRFNSDTGSNYAMHQFYNITGYNETSATYLYLTQITESGRTGIFAPFLVDIYNYTNTSNFKTLRSIGGYFINATGVADEFDFGSGLWRSTSAITSITLDVRTGGSGSFSQYSHFALYGIKG
jgi:hypothetical protein